MFSSDEKGYSRPLIDWKNADDKGNITFRHQVSESFLRNYILHYNYQNQNIKVKEGYTDASYYLKRYIRAMINEDDAGNNVWGKTKNNILPVNGYMEIGKEVKKSWDRIERIDLKYEISDTYSDIDNQALLDYLEVCTIYEEQSQLVCNLILEILADIHKQFHIDSTNSWFESNRDDSYGWGNFLDDWVKLTFTKWSSEKGHIDWTTTWDDFANVINKAPEPIHSFVNLVFSIIKLSVFSVLFPPISALALISYSYEMLSMKSFGAKAKSFNLLMQDLLDLYLSKEGYQVKTFDNEIKRHKNQSSEGYIQYDPIVGKTNFEFFNYAWKVSPLTFPHKPFQYSNYEIIFGFEQLHDFKNKLTHAGANIEKDWKKFNDGQGSGIYPHDILSNKRKYWKHITTQLISLFELIGKRNQKPVLAVPQPNGKVRIYSWNENSLHYNATQKAPSGGEKDWRWAGYEIKPKPEKTTWYEYTKYRTKAKRMPEGYMAEDDDKTYNTNPEITLVLKHQEIEASQYDLIRYCPNALQAWKQIPYSGIFQPFGRVQGGRIYNQIGRDDLDLWIYADPLLIIGNEYLTEETEMDNSELLKYLGLQLGITALPTVFKYDNDELEKSGDFTKAFTFNRKHLTPQHSHYKLLEMVNLHPDYPSPEEGDKVFSRAIGKDNSILNIPVYDLGINEMFTFNYGDDEVYEIAYNSLRNELVLNGSIDENAIGLFGENEKRNYSLRKSLEIGRINGEGWKKDWTNMFYPNTTVINVLGRKPTDFINWYINPTLDVMTQDDYGKSDSTKTKQDEPPSKGEVVMPIQPHPDDELIIEDNVALDDDMLRGYGENVIRARAGLGWNDEDDRRFERLMRERRRNNP